MSANDTSRRMMAWTLAWFVATLVSFSFLLRPSTTGLDEDEIYWIGSAYYFHLAFQRADWSHPDWKLLPARENPPVAKYVLGLGLTSAGHPVRSIDLLGTFYLMFERVPNAWGTGADHAKRDAVVSRVRDDFRAQVRAGARVQFEPALLSAARRTIVVCAALMSLVVFLLGTRLSTPLTGLIASQLLGAHPAVVSAYNHAHADIVALLFSAAAALAAFALIQRSLADRAHGFASQLLLAVAGGALLALSCGAKMNSLVVAAVAAMGVLVAVVAAWRRDAARGRPALICGVVFFSTGFLFFLLVNPSILADIPAGLLATFREHRLTEAIQARFLRDHLDSLPAKFAAVGQLTCFSRIGLIALILIALAVLATKPIGLRWTAMWFLVGVICVTLWVPFPRGRYVLPVVLPATLLLGGVFDWICTALLRRSSRISKTQP